MPLCDGVPDWLTLRDRDVFNGVLTLDKLRAAHRRLGGGAAELWALLVAHLGRLVLGDKARADDMSK